MLTGQYDIDLAVKRTLETATARAGKALEAIPDVSSGLFGLTPDTVKTSLAYIEAKRNFDVTFLALRKFNTAFVRRYKRQYTAMRQSR